MTVYSYVAVDSNQAKVRGKLTADSPKQARDQLRTGGLRVLSMSDSVEPHSSGLLSNLFRRRNVSQTVTFYRELSTMISVGIPVTEALQTLTKQYKGQMRQTLMQVTENITKGKSLAEAFREFPHEFDTMAVQMVEVGEAAGNLDRILEQLADFKERSLQLKDRVFAALLYPLIVFIVGIGVCLFLVTFVVPTLLANLAEAGRELPWPTRVLKSASDLLMNHWAIFFLIAFFLGGFVIFALKSKTGQRLWHPMQLRVPVLGSMVLRQDLSRVSMVLAALLRSGIHYVKASELAAKSAKNIVIRAALEESGKLIAKGADIGQAISRMKIFPPLVVHVFQIGQNSGRLEEMLEKLSDSYDRQVASLANRLAAILEPCLILVLAVFVGFVLFATILPILEAGNVLS